MTAVEPADTTAGTTPIRTPGTGSDDLAGRYLRQVVRLLPASRRDWGDAMRAELGSIQSRGERARFALSCTRVAFGQSALTQLGWHLLAAVALVIAVLADDIQYPALRNRLVGAVLVLVALSFVGSRRSRSARCARSRPPGWVRAGGYLLVGFDLFLELFGYPWPAAARSA